MPKRSVCLPIRPALLASTWLLVAACQLMAATKVIIPQLDFIEGDGGALFASNDEIIVKVRNFDQTMFPNLRGRLYRGTAEELIMRPQMTVSGCSLYDPDLLELRFSGSDIHIGRGSTVTKGVAGNWVVVFEQGDWPQGPVKIETDAVRAYFEHGFRFQVTAPSESYSSGVSNSFGRLVAPIANLFQRSSRTVGNAATGSSGLPKERPAAQQRREALAAAEKMRRAELEKAASVVVCVRFKNSPGRTLRSAIGCSLDDTRMANLSPVIAWPVTSRDGRLLGGFGTLPSILRNEARLGSVQVRCEESGF